MTTIVQHPLKEWEEALLAAHIDFEKFEDHLFARIDKRDDEGHHHMHLNIYFEEGIGVYANFCCLGEIIPKLPPAEAIQKFKLNKLVFFTD